MKRLKISAILLAVTILGFLCNASFAQCLSSSSSAITISTAKSVCSGTQIFSGNVLIASGGTLTIPSTTVAYFTNIQFAGTGASRGKLIVSGGDTYVNGTLYGVNPDIEVNSNGSLNISNVTTTGGVINTLNIKEGFVGLQSNVNITNLLFGLTSTSAVELDTVNLTLNTVTTTSTNTLVIASAITLQGGGSIKGCWNADNFYFTSSTPILFSAARAGGNGGWAANMSFTNTVFSTGSTGYLDIPGTCTVTGTLSIPSTVSIYKTGACTVGSATVIGSPVTGGCY